MDRIILKGPESTAIVSSENSNKETFEKFLAWLKEYNYAKKWNFESYPIKSQNRLSQCKIKARKLGLKVN